MRSRSLLLLTLLLPLPARAALTPVGSPLVIAESSFCAFNTSLSVTATPKGAFEVVWANDGDGFVDGQRFTRGLLATGSPQHLLPLHGGLFFKSNFLGAWTGRYEVALNALDEGDNPDDPLAGYRVSLDAEGKPLAPAARFKPPHFFKLAPAAGGDSLQIRTEPPVFGPPTCKSEGLLASRIDAGGAPLGPESRITRRASAFNLGLLQVERLPDDSFLTVYSTCEKLTGLVARHLNAPGAPVGDPINLPLPGPLGNFGSLGLVLAARDSSNFVAGAMIFTSTGQSGSYTRGVVNGQVFGPTLLPIPAGGNTIPALIDLEASPAGGYLLLFESTFGDPAHFTLFAQELDAKGVPQGAAVEIAEQGSDVSSSGIGAAAASLPNGRWIVVARVQSGDPSTCTESLVGTVLESN